MASLRHHISSWSQQFWLRSISYSVDHEFFRKKISKWTLRRSQFSSARAFYTGGAEADCLIVQRGNKSPWPTCFFVLKMSVHVHFHVFMKFLCILLHAEFKTIMSRNGKVMRALEWLDQWPLSLDNLVWNGLLGMAVHAGCFILTRRIQWLLSFQIWSPVRAQVPLSFRLMFFPYFRAQSLPLFRASC